MDRVKKIRRVLSFFRASSILEVTVAMVIVSLSFSIFLVIYLNVMSGSRYFQRVKYEAIIAKEYRELVRTRNFSDAQITDGTVRIFRSVTQYRGDPNIKYITLKAVSSGGKVLAEYKSLLYVAD